MKRFFLLNLFLLVAAATIAPAAMAGEVDANGDGVVSVHERRLAFLSPGAGG